MDQLGVDFFHDVTEVHFLDSRRSITNEQLRKLKRLDELQVLYLMSPAINDDGLAELRALAKLEDLRILRVYGFESSDEIESPPQTIQVTDRGLEHLTSLTNLRILHLDETRVKHGAQVLSDALPDCLINVIQDGHDAFFKSPAPATSTLVIGLWLLTLI